MNVEPSRIGSLRRLFDVYARCARERRPMYGGGMGELGVGRGQIELLAGLFHADAPNDLAPSAYNEDDPPRGLPASPLAPRPGPPAFAGRRRRAHRAPRTSSACVIAVVVGWIRRLAEAPTTLGVAVLRQTGRLDVV